jgi:putative salt-induced outer membrane protein
MRQDPASSGNTDVATSGFEAQAVPEEEAKDAQEANVSLGGMQSSGNSRSLAATMAAQYRLRRRSNQLSALAAANFARSAATPDENMRTTVENYQAKVRYDRFLLERLAVFIATSGRRDRFQGLDLRLNVDPGVAYYFIDEQKHQLWSELGYDLQYDLRNQDSIDAAALQGQTVEKTATQHSGRAFAGYANSLNEAATLTTGVEFLLGLPETERWRLNWDAGLSSKIGGAFSLATTFSLKYDHAPLPGVKELDTTTALSLVYQLL